MDKSEIRIFVVEDDPTLSKALGEAIKKMGFQPVVCTNPSDAQNQFRIQGGHLLIIDCLLPKMSGVDLVGLLRNEEGAKDTPVILTSGIFKDKAFIKESMQKTKAIAFVAKPFNIKDITDIVKSAVEGLVDEDLSPLETLLISNPTPAERIDVVNRMEQLEAYDIPWNCTLLMNPSTSGILKLQHDKSPAAISFAQGKISHVEMQNPESFFGALLIENGYLTPEQLNQALKAQSQKKIGERLVDLNFLSPHVIDVINAEQTAIRLSRLINDSVYTVSFTEKPLESTPSSLDTESLAPFLADWTNSKIQPDWLKKRYLKWLNSPATKVEGAIMSHQRIWTLPPLKNAPALVALFEKGASLGQVLGKGQYPEETIYQVFHLLVLIEHIRIKREIKALDINSQKARLKKIWADMQGQDYFAVLGVSRTVKPADLKKTYHDLAKIFHSDKVPVNADNELRDLAQKVFGRMTQAYETLSNEQKRAAHVKEIEHGKAEKILQAENALEEGKALLKSGQPSRAQEKFKYAIELKLNSSEVFIHLAWAELLSMEASSGEGTLAEVDATLNKIPPEDRHNAIYYFVKALYLKITGDIPSARKNILHALSLKPKFIEAERMLRVLDMTKQNEKSINILHGDLKDVMGNLFKKK